MLHESNKLRALIYTLELKHHSASLGRGAGRSHYRRGVGDDLGESFADLFLLESTFTSCHEDIVLFFLMLKPLGEGVNRALPLCLVQLSVLLHQEDARARFFYKLTLSCLLEW